MQTLIWAFGSMVVILLGLFITPLGFTLKGKVTIALASFVLGLGGIVAASSFPLWETALMLLALVFIFTYFIDKRMGAMVYQSNSLNEPALLETAVALDTFESPEAIELLKDYSINVINEPLKMPDASLIAISEEPLMSNDSHSTLDKLDLASQRELVMEEEWKKGIMDKDLSLLMERETDSENENLQLAESESKIGYLSDIENLLEIEAAGISEILEDDGLDNLLEEIDTKKQVGLQKI